MSVKKVKVTVASMNRCWTHPSLFTRTKVGDILEVQGVRYGGYDVDLVYYLVKNTDGLMVCLFENEVEVYERD